MSDGPSTRTTGSLGPFLPYSVPPAVGLPALTLDARFQRVEGIRAPPLILGGDRPSQTAA